MKTKMLLRVAAPLFLAALGIVPIQSGCGVAGIAGAAACPDFTASAKFGASLSIDSDVKTFMQAAGNFQVLGKAMVADVGDACTKIAIAAGGDKTKWDGMTGSDLVTAACTEADTKLTAALAGAQIQVVIQGGQCKVSIQVTADCNASCDVSGKCTPAQLEAKCEPGKLAGSCSASCMGSCSADTGSIDCAGSCDATCTGTCMGTCMGRCDGMASTAACAGMCEGTCSASCSGTCSGRCTYTDPMATCKGTCHGDCSVAYTAPYCEGKFTPPECNIQADCEANCEASATAQAVCTPPAVTYAVTSGNGADLSALAMVLQDTLPVFVVNTVDRGTGLVTSVDALVTSGNAIANKTDLAADAAACAAAAAAAAVEAAADIKVSVQFSVKLSASASGQAMAM